MVSALGLAVSRVVYPALSAPCALLLSVISCSARHTNLCQPILCLTAAGTPDETECSPYRRRKASLSVFLALTIRLRLSTHEAAALPPACRAAAEGVTPCG